MKRKENKDLMMQMLRDGLPYKEIAEATGYKVTSLHRYAQDIEERKEHQNTGVKSYKDLIIRWFEQGKTAEEIGELIGYSPVTVKTNTTSGSVRRSSGTNRKRLKITIRRAY